MPAESPATISRINRKMPAAQTRRMTMKTILSAAIALSVLVAAALPAGARPDPRNPAVEISDFSPN